MKSDLDTIGTRSSDTHFQSIYVPFISFANEKQKDSIERYIFQQVDDFFLKISPGVNATQLSYSKVITEKDYQEIQISYFYDNLFHDLERGSDGKLKLKVKWSITFDERCTPIQLVNLPANYRGHEPNPKFLDKDNEGRPHRKYGTIEINGVPIFYYIYFTLQEILDVVKQSS
ncbi:hypothetical protein H6G74_28105 [Nostoc spongiaeforme FACHB-130]|uniref:Uncharacterized protein n=1 Tax=Nostoc spongiaeforme FACHB-130 TaxID=1357510 RepID=A0ABR8G4J3_9NOSO|nr:hypothetical protein [Nostoc spongiaeforme]MBD2598160.1 hypothetical protein [Nostoc spongiaeforme FACHB-130]